MKIWVVEQVDDEGEVEWELFLKEKKAFEHWQYMKSLDDGFSYFLFYTEAIE